MGTATLHQHVVLTPQTQLVTVIDVRFCESQVVTLRKRFKLFHGGVTYHNVPSDTRRFKFKDKLFSKYIAIVEAEADAADNKTPILALQMRQRQCANHCIKVFPGAKREGAELFQICVKFQHGEKSEL